MAYGHHLGDGSVLLIKFGHHLRVNHQPRAERVAESQQRDELVLAIRV